MSAEHGSAETPAAIDDSLKRASSAEYFDLILLHDPKAGREKRLEAYKALLEAQKEGKAKSVGVSSFGVKHLKEIEDAGLPAPCELQDLCGVPPCKSLTDFSLPLYRSCQPDRAARLQSAERHHQILSRAWYNSSSFLSYSTKQATR